MQTLIDYKEIIAFSIARIFLGFLFFFQGYDAVVKIKMRNVIDTYHVQFENKGIPKWLIKTGVYFTSLTELLGGTLLLFGFGTYPALILLGLNLLVAAVGFGISTPMWDTRFVFPRLILIVFLLLAPLQWNLFSVDYFLGC